MLILAYFSRFFILISEENKRFLRKEDMLC